MIFTETSLPGVYTIDIEPVEDSRGFFARGWCRKEFAAHDLDAAISQMNISVNSHAGTLRGLHYQIEPHAEAKTIRCVRGAVFDVAVDMRESSPNYLQWIGHELSAENHRSLYIPKGFDSLISGKITQKLQNNAILAQYIVLNYDRTISHGY